MSRILFLVTCVASMFLGSNSAFSQGRIGADPAETLKREIELLKREIDLLKRENDLLKAENAELKKRGSSGSSSGSRGDNSGDVRDDEPVSVTRVVVDDVEYVYLGIDRAAGRAVVTILATSQDGNRPAPGGQMTLVDDKGNKYTGMPAGGFGAPAALREGIPVKLTWVFGGASPLGLNRAPAPSATINRFAGVMINRQIAGDDTIDFRNVPAVVSRAKSK